MITEDYVSFETAKLLKEKGFNDEVKSFYGYDSEFKVWEFEEDDRWDTPNNWGSYYCSAPTLQMAMKWLREKYRLEIYPYHDMFQENNKWWYGIEKFTKGCSNCQYEEEPIYSTYEEACEAAIKYCLENLIQDEERRKIKSL